MERIRLLALLASAVAALGCTGPDGPGPTPRRTVESRGVGGGGALYSPALSPHTRELMMTTDMSGVFRSRDFGKSWSTIDYRSLQGGPRSQFQYTSDPDVVYAVGVSVIPGRIVEAHRLVKSIDGGRTWDAPVLTPGEPDRGQFLLVDPGSALRLLYSDSSNLYFSKDGGRSFRLVHTTAWEGGLVVAGAFWNGRDIFVGTPDGLLVSHDDGASFAVDAAFVGIPDAEAMVSLAGASDGTTTRLFAVTFARRDSGGGPAVNLDLTGGNVDLFASVYRLSLPSTTWQRVSEKLDATERFTFVAMAAGRPDTAYLAGGQRHDETPALNAPAVLKTTDGGNTWRSVFRTTGNANIATGWSGDGGDFSWEFGEYALGFAVAANDPDRAVLTDLGFVHVTSDGGETWQQAYVRPADQNPMGSPTPPSRAYRTSGVEQTSGWWMTFADRDTLFASMTDVRSQRSTDGGLSWSRDSRSGLSLNTTYHTAVQPGTGVLYAATGSVHDLYQSPYLRDSRLDGTASRRPRGGIMKSSDAGATWTQVHDFGKNVIWLAFDPNQPALLYASTVHSVDGGIYRLDLGQPGSAPVRLPAPPRTKGHAFVVHVLHDGTLVATYSGHQDGNTRVFQERSGVFVLPKGATAWEDRSDPAMRFWTKDLVIDPRDPAQSSWYVGVFGHLPPAAGAITSGLFRTRDRGATWQRISDHYRVESVTFDPRHGQRLYLATSDGLWMSEEIDAAQPQFTRVVEYPFRHPTRVFLNPFDDRETWVMSFGGGMRVITECRSAPGSTTRAPARAARCP